MLEIICVYKKIEKKQIKIHTRFEPSLQHVVLMSEFDVQKDVEEVERKGNDRGDEVRERRTILKKIKKIF
ncbi:hypothetical protein BC643_2665 [Mangrovibacterium diazotrophicum]|uniref:Uncharacterized protein n=1 Tax=Mangrovibacterium diazotrophicum TaxID=1261403 RepID=A0A419WA47_9BACT|nr:hypothetical protein BC643_2665 [Mangrovibacterium diazotrophicum]